MASKRYGGKSDNGAGRQEYTLKTLDQKLFQEKLLMNS